MKIFDYFRKKKITKEILKIDPYAVERVRREYDIVIESVGLMENTNKLSTLVNRYTDALFHAQKFNDMTMTFGEQVDSKTIEDIDSLLISRLHELVEKELSEAMLLKTEKGIQGRVLKIINVLESCDRVEGGRVEEALSEEQSRLFKMHERNIDWSKEPDHELSIDLEAFQQDLLDKLNNAQK